MKEAGKMPWKKEESVTETVTVMDESRRESEWDNDYGMSLCQTSALKTYWRL